MKHKTLYLTNILIVLSAVMFMVSCHDDENGEWNYIIPSESESSPLTVKDAVGTLLYSQEEKQWQVLFEIADRGDSLFHRHFGFEEGAVVLINNLSDELKDYSGKVKINGTMRLDFVKTPSDYAKNPIGPIYYYRLEISNIEKVSENTDNV